MLDGRGGSPRGPPSWLLPPPPAGQPGLGAPSTHLSTDSTNTLSALMWIQAMKASLKFTLSQRSSGPCEDRTACDARGQRHQTPGQGRHGSRQSEASRGETPGDQQKQRVSRPRPTFPGHRVPGKLSGPPPGTCVGPPETGLRRAGQQRTGFPGHRATREPISEERIASPRPQPRPGISHQLPLPGAPQSPPPRPQPQSPRLEWPVLQGSPSTRSQGSEPPLMPPLPTKVKGGSSQRSQGRRAGGLTPTSQQGLPPSPAATTSRQGRGPLATKPGGGGQLRRRLPHEEAGSVLGSLMEALPSHTGEQKTQGAVSSEDACTGGDMRAGEPRGCRGAAYLALALTLSLSVRLPRRGPIGVT